MRTRFILIEPSHAGNVGAVARAMKVMGFDDLVLVRPRWANVLQKQEAIERASGATDILKKAQIVDHVDQALEGVHHVCTTAMQARDFGPPTVAPRAYLANLPAQLPSDSQIAFVFGPERYGLSNEDVYRSHICLSIPTNNPVYGSLNLAAAVQLIAYDWREALGSFPVDSIVSAPLPADVKNIEMALAHWQQALEALAYLDPQHPKKLMPRLRRMIWRAQPSDIEINILRGVARAILQASASKKG